MKTWAVWFDNNFYGVRLWLLSEQTRNENSSRERLSFDVLDGGLRQFTARCRRKQTSSRSSRQS